MGHHEANLLRMCPEDLKKLIFCFERFIDDIFIIWLDTQTQLMNFHKYLNKSHKTIQFDEPQHDVENNSCNFLDLKIAIEERKIVTDIYRKSTDNPSALLPSSSHPQHVSKNIVYTLAFRLLRICSTREILERRLEELQNQQLKLRNYRPSLIKKVFDEILKMDRKEALKKKKRQSLEDHHSTIHKTIKHLQCPQCQHKPSDLESLKTHLSSVHGTIYSKQIVQHQKKDRIIGPMT